MNRVLDLVYPVIPSKEQYIMSLKIDLRKTSIAPETSRLVSTALARKHSVLPIAKRPDGSLVVAFRNHEGETEQGRMESILDALDAVEDAAGCAVVPFFVEDTAAFDQLHKRIYSKSAANSFGSEALFREIINQALIQRASDIHLDADEEGATVRFRIDGKVHDFRSLKEQEMAELTAVIKLHADLDIAERRTPLDGAISMELDGDEISLRLATIPTLNGEHLTLRILANSGAENLADLNALCMADDHLKLLKEALDAPNGIILVSGPTGSGKTTTLYAALRHLRDLGGRHIVSLEDPVEMPLAGVTQVRIDEGGERVTFNKALRSVLRHDPDVVLIGEIRDEETADIAVRAALTGHLVLSTVHTNDAIGVVYPSARSRVAGLSCGGHGSPRDGAAPRASSQSARARMERCYRRGMPLYERRSGASATAPPGQTDGARRRYGLCRPRSGL